MAASDEGSNVEVCKVITYSMMFLHLYYNTYTTHVCTSYLYYIISLMYVQVIDCSTWHIPCMSGKNPDGYLVKADKSIAPNVAVLLKNQQPCAPKVNAVSLVTTCTLVESIL